MLKKLIYTLLFLVVMPVFAGEYEDAVTRGGPVLLYLHTSTCQYCKQAAPVYKKLSQNYKNQCKFLSVDADTQYGTTLMLQFGARYVPYTILIDSNKQFFEHISPECMVEYACVEKELKQFIK